jgi:predicted small secreted protein
MKKHARLLGLFVLLGAVATALSACYASAGVG